jgi:hypothetical protein
VNDIRHWDIDNWAKSSWQREKGTLSAAEAEFLV